MADGDVGHVSHLGFLGPAGITYLTGRQADVLRLAAGGLFRKQIARTLGISVRTVHDHFSAMRRRTGARSDGQLIAYGVAAGLVTPSAGLPSLPDVCRALANPGTKAPALARGDAQEQTILNSRDNNAPQLAPGPPQVLENVLRTRSVGQPPQHRFPYDNRLTTTPPGADLAVPDAKPVSLTGTLIGYARVSTGGQRLDRQLHNLTEAGCLRIFADKQPGRTTDRPELRQALNYLRAGDTLVVPSLDRLGRSLHDLITIVSTLRGRGIGLRSLHEALDTTTPDGRLVSRVFAALAEFIRELSVEGTRDGLAAAEARGQRLGRPPAMAPEQIRHARALLSQPDATVASIARLFGVSRSTIYKHIPEANGGYVPVRSLTDQNSSDGEQAQSQKS
jgi:DNA invertase Pin-like site-specific DNA recombinase